MKTIILLMFLVVPEFAFAEGVLTPAANPPQPISVLSVSGIPFIKASSGTMGNNGAVSAMTALPRIFSAGAYLYLPAGAVAAGVPAAATWYWFVGSSTTAGTVYNNTYTSGTPTAPASPTAFATTGPGAYIGLTTSPVAVTVSIPANLMGANGRTEILAVFSANNSGGLKTSAIKFGAATCFSVGLSTQLSAVPTCAVTNRGRATVQGISSTYQHESFSGQGIAQAVDAAENTATNVNVTITLNTAVATDHDILDGYQMMVIHGD